EIRANFSAEAVARLITRRFKELQLGEPRVPRTTFRVHGAKNRVNLFHPDTPAKVAEEIRAWSSKPFISVITPIYNVAGTYLRRCVESVRAQYYPFWELCLCDDGSTNSETLEVLESYRGIDARIKIVTLPANQGISAASNRAAE